MEPKDVELLSECAKSIREALEVANNLSDWTGEEFSRRQANVIFASLEKASARADLLVAKYLAQVPYSLRPASSRPPDAEES